ncbi:Transketolase 1 [bacterium HR29]|nr:Transketolase 1 [bacterium HR29]
MGVDEAFVRELAQQLRVDAIRITALAGSGHPTSSLSAAELIAVLAAGHLRYDFERPDHPLNDELIFSKGHASPLLYALYRAVGAISEEELLTYRRFGSRLEGHPTPVLPWVKVATGSLGQGLPIGVGVALAAKRLDRLPYRVWVLCGDSEMAEGSMWEAVEHAAHWSLDNLVAIVDVNRLGQAGETMYGWNTRAYAERFRAFGWHTIEIDGHDVRAIDEAYREATAMRGRPTAVIARTVKGKGVPWVEDQNGAHGKPIERSEEAIALLGGVRNLTVRPLRPPAAEPHRFPSEPHPLPSFAVGEKVATRFAYGKALAALGSRRGDVVALDAEVKNSTFAEFFEQAHPERFFELHIAEQQMIAAAVGMQARGWRPFASSFAAFLTRAADFVRMAAVSRANLCLVGSHAGVSIGQDGPSQMGLEDLALFRAIHGSTVLYPCDANQTVALVEAMASVRGIAYLRTTRAATSVLYESGRDFPIGGSVTLNASADDAVTIVAAGITLHEALAAAQQLRGRGIAARVVDAYSVKPIDAGALAHHAAATGRLVIAEDHWPEGGLGEAVLAAIADVRPFPSVRHLAVRGMPGSGTPEELLAAAGIDAAAIVQAALDLCDDAHQRPPK